MYILLVFAPYITLARLGLPQGFEKVDPELIVGLLTGSSIFFSFATLPMRKSKKDKLLLLFLLGDIFLLGESCVSLFQLGIGHASSLESLFWVASSFGASMVTAVYRFAQEYVTV
jgi:hypothetical protein